MPWPDSPATAASGEGVSFDEADALRHEKDANFIEDFNKETVAYTQRRQRYSGIQRNSRIHTEETVLQWHYDAFPPEIL